MVCPMCGKWYSETEFELCRRCEIAQDHHPEEVAARWAEIDREIRSRINCILADAEDNDQAAVDDNTSYLIDYVLGLLP